MPSRSASTRQEWLNNRLSSSLDPNDLSHHYEPNDIDNGSSSRPVSTRASSVDGIVNVGVDNHGTRNGSVFKPSPSEGRSVGCRRRIRRFLSAVTVEPAIFVHMLVTSIEGTVLANLVLHKVCVNEIGLPDSECLYNTSNSTVEDAVQVHATNANMFIILADTFPGIMMSILMGAYSDRRGRKLPIIAPILGYILSSALFVAFTYYEETPAAYLCLAVLPRALGGGLIAFNSSCLSYVSDISTKERRTERVAMVEAALFLGTPIGTIVGGYLSTPSLIMYAYVLGIGLDVIVCIYLALVIRNPSSVTGSSCNVREHLHDFFDLGNVKLTLSTVFKKRSNDGRKHLLLLLATLFPHLVAFFGSASVMYLFVRLKYSWDILTYSYFSAFTICAVAVGLVLTLVIFVRWLHVSDLWLAIGGTLCGLIYNLAVTFSVSSTTLCLAVIPAAFSSIGMLSIRSMISKLVPSEEQGKVFSVSASLDALAPIVTSVGYSQLYTATLVTFPEACFVLSAVVLIIPLILLAILHVDNKVRFSIRTMSYFPIDP